MPKNGRGRKPNPGQEIRIFLFPEKVATCSLFDPSLATDSLKKTLLAFLHTHFFRFFLPSFSLCPPLSHKIIKLDLDIVFSSPPALLSPPTFMGNIDELMGYIPFFPQIKKGAEKTLRIKKMDFFVLYFRLRNKQIAKPLILQPT